MKARSDFQATMALAAEKGQNVRYIPKETDIAAMLWIQNWRHGYDYQKIGRIILLILKCQLIHILDLQVVVRKFQMVLEKRRLERTQVVIDENVRTTI